MKKLILLLFIISVSFAQQSWIRTYGGWADDLGYSIQQTLDGGYIITGQTNSFGPGDNDVYLVKIDSIGDTIWTKMYGGVNDEDGRSVRQTSDSGYIIAGSTNSFGNYCQVYLIKTNAFGDTLWTRTYGGTNWDEGCTARQTIDGGYIIAGSTASFGQGCHVYLIKTNALGDTLWTRIYGGSNYYDICYSLQQTLDGGYIITGRTQPSDGDFDIILIKTNASGDTLWTRTYGGIYDEEGFSVQQTTDGGYIIAGYTSSYGVGFLPDVYLIKTDSIGDTLWTRTYGEAYPDIGKFIQQTTDGGYIVTANISFSGAGVYDVYLIKTNAYGDTIWTRIYGGIDNDQGNFIQQTTDGGYIVAGYTASYWPNTYDVYLIKTDANGNAAVEETNSREQSLDVKLKAKPNPFASFTRIPGYEKEDFNLSDITGRMVGKYKGAKIGENLPAGVYFIVPQNKKLSPLRIVKIK